MVFCKFMTKEEILYNLIQIDTQIDYLKKNKSLDGYNKDKVHLKQMQFHKCLSKNRWVFGGNRSGKTDIE